VTTQRRNREFIWRKGPARFLAEPAPAKAVFAGSDQACMSVDSRDKIGVLHATASVCALALRIGR
jgi:hypothetical protein